MDIIAHRGGKYYKPENSIEAILNASNYTSKIEIDVRRCKSGELVLHHDYINKTQDNTYGIKTTPLPKLKNLTIKNSNTEIPTLKEALEKLPENINLYVELKETGIAKDTAELCEQHNINTQYISFLDKPLQKLKNSKTGKIFITGWKHEIQKAKELNCNTICPVHYIIDKQRITEAKNKNFKINTWTVDNIKEAKRLQNIGVDELTSNKLKPTHLNKPQTN